MIRKNMFHYKILEKLGEGGIFQNYPRIEDEWFVILITPDDGFAQRRRILISEAKSGGIV